MSSWSNISITNCYENSYEYDRDKESHLIKNSEWGAVAYLAHSKYGRNGTEVAINDNGGTHHLYYQYYTGGTQDLNKIYEENANQSSTGNETGIYDLNGNTLECIAGYNKAYAREGYYFGGAGGNTSVYRPADTTKRHFAYNLNGKSDKYVTAYNNSTNTDSEDFSVGDVSHVGDAFHEVWMSSYYGWFTDGLWFVTLDEPYYARGGYFFAEDNSGIFAASPYYGHGGFHLGFRVVLV